MTKLVAATLTASVLAIAASAAAGTSAATPAQSPTAQKNIVQTAVAAGKFKTLVALVEKAGLAGTLSAPGNLTVFAPTDDAFAALPEGTLHKAYARGVSHVRLLAFSPHASSRLYLVQASTLSPRLMFATLAITNCSKRSPAEGWAWFIALDR